MTLFAGGFLVGVLVMGLVALALVRHEARKPWWRS